MKSYYVFHCITGPGTINVRRLGKKTTVVAGVIVAQTGGRTACGVSTEYSIYVSVYEHLEWIEFIAGHCVRYIEQCTIL